jgi:hypothetical protein
LPSSPPMAIRPCLAVLPSTPFSGTGGAGPRRFIWDLLQFRARTLSGPGRGQSPARRTGCDTGHGRRGPFDNSHCTPDMIRPGAWPARTIRQLPLHAGRSARHVPTGTSASDRALEGVTVPIGIRQIRDTPVTLGGMASDRSGRAKSEVKRQSLFRCVGAHWRLFA